MNRLLVAVVLVGALSAVAAQAADETVTLSCGGQIMSGPLGTGTKATISGELGSPTGEAQDAFYAYNNAIPTQAPSMANALFVRSDFPGSTTKGELSAFLDSATYPAYQPSHVYHLTIGSDIGPATFTCQTSLPGSFTLTVPAPDQPSKIVSISRKVEVQKSDGAWQPAVPGMSLEPGDKIHTGFKAQATVTLPDGSTVVVGPMSLAIIQYANPDGTTRLLLRLGEVSATVNRTRGNAADFHVRTPTTTASVRGTEFSVFYDGQSTIVSVALHSVLVTPNSGAAVIVPAGREVASTSTGVGPLSPIGMAGAPPGSVGPAAAIALLTGKLAKGLKACKSDAYSTALKPNAHGWRATVQLVGKHPGRSSWTINRRRVSASNALARKIASGCR